MHTGVISFCDRIAFNIKSSDTKDEILLDLAQKFQIQILQKHWHRLDENGVQQLSRSPHFACLRSNGNPYYLYFTKHEDVPIMYYIDKKIQPGYQKPRIILGRGKFNERIFQNTLVEGEMVKDKYGHWVFLVNDVLGYQNEHLWKLTLPQRIEYAYSLFAENFTPDPIMDMCAFQVKAYAHATQEGIRALIELYDTLPYTSRGIYLWPFSLKFKPKLYNFDETLIKSVVRKVKDNPEFRETSTTEEDPEPQPLPECKPVTVTQNQETTQDDCTMWLRKTENPDVYDVYTTDHGMVQNTKVGVAHVPSLKISKWLRSEFKNTTVAMYIPFVCTKHTEFEKWIPIRKIVTSCA